MSDRADLKTINHTHFRIQPLRDPAQAFAEDVAAANDWARAHEYRFDAVMANHDARMAARAEAERTERAAREARALAATPNRAVPAWRRLVAFIARRSPAST